MAQQGAPGVPPVNAGGPPVPLLANALVPPAAAPVRNFRDLYASMPDLYNGTYSGLLEVFAPGATPAIDIMNSVTQHTTFNRVPSVFVYQDPNNNIRTVCQLHRIETILGQVPGAWNDVRLGYASDVHHGQVTSVIVPHDRFFEATPLTTVPTIVEMMGAWNADPDIMILAPMAAGAADTEDITSRRALPVPHAYIPLLLFQVLTPRQAWEQVGAQIIADNRTVDCQQLLNFLRIASVATPHRTRQGVRQAPNVAQPAALQPPLADEVLLDYIHQHLTRCLPALYQTGPDMNQQLMQGTALIRETLQEQAATMRAERVAAQDEANAPTTLTKVYPGIAPAIRKLCNSGDDDEALPEFWNLFAEAKGRKVQAFPGLEALVNARSNEPTSSMVQTILPAQLYEMISQFRLGSADLENIQMGLSIFNMCPAGYYKAAAQVEINATYNMLQGDGGQATLNEIRQLIGTGYNVPANLYQLIEFIGALSVLVDVLIGPTEPLATALLGHFRYWQRNLSPVRAALTNPNAEMTIIVGVMRAIQLTTITYINEKMNIQLLHVAPPSFYEIEQTINQRTFVLPPLPDRYFVPPSSATPRSTQPAKTPGGGVTTAATGNPPVKRPFSGVPVQAPPNQQVNTWIEKFTAPGQVKTIQQLKQLPTTRQPKVADGSYHLCLAYHLKGTCFDNCRNKASHRPLDKEEKSVMQKFVDAEL